jgi:hypothetical protein
MIIKKDPHLVRYIALSFIGILLVLVAVSSPGMLQRSQACGDQPCQPNGSWTVNFSGCFSLCSCGGNLRSAPAITSPVPATMIQIIVLPGSRPVIVADVAVPVATAPDNQ